MWSLQNHLGDKIDHLFKSSDNVSSMSQNAHITSIGQKMDRMIQCLGLSPYDTEGHFQEWLNPISAADIAPVQLLCPNTAECETVDCDGRGLLQTARERDISHVTLCADNQVYHNVALLSGQCSDCQASPVHILLHISEMLII